MIPQQSDPPGAEPLAAPRRWRPFVLHPFSIAFVVLLAVVVGIVFHYRLHFLWVYSARRLDLYDIHAIACGDMPETSIPDNWVPCHFGGMELSLPPELAENKLPPNGSVASRFSHGLSDLGVGPPEDTTEMSQYFDAMSKLSPASRRLTRARFRLACFEADADNFRWSMTPEEVVSHTFYATNSKLIIHPREGRVETLFRDDIEGLLHFFSDRSPFSVANKRWQIWWISVF
ncbi:MAG: hypothetical protein K1X71_00390 [Pirellulales bacterium]|nr:hypothetical protein [Pirellulales bacterium]